MSLSSISSSVWEVSCRRNAFGQRSDCFLSARYWSRNLRCRESSLGFMVCSSSCSLKPQPSLLQYWLPLLHICCILRAEGFHFNTLSAMRFNWGAILIQSRTRLYALQRRCFRWTCEVSSAVFHRRVWNDPVPMLYLRQPVSLCDMPNILRYIQSHRQHSDERLGRKFDRAAGSIATFHALCPDGLALLLKGAFEVAWVDRTGGQSLGIVWIQTPRPLYGSADRWGEGWVHSCAVSVKYDHGETRIARSGFPIPPGAIRLMMGIIIRTANVVLPCNMPPTWEAYGMGCERDDFVPHGVKRTTVAQPQRAEPHKAGGSKVKRYL